MEPQDRDVHIRKAEAFYRSKLRAKLEPEHNGEYIAIDTDKGDYALGDSFLDACLNAQKKHSSPGLVCLRIGYPAARFIGNFI